MKYIFYCLALYVFFQREAHHDVALKPRPLQVSTSLEFPHLQEQQNPNHAPPRESRLARRHLLSIEQARFLDRPKGVEEVDISISKLNTSAVADLASRGNLGYANASFLSSEHQLIMWL
jgi:hypothetical protein